MHCKAPSSMSVPVLLLGVLTCLSGCATTGMERATRTTDLMQTVEDDYKKASDQIDITNASLAALMQPGLTDLKPAYDAYADNVDKMEALGKKVDVHTEKMSTRGKEYFAEWENSYTNPAIRELSERRRITLREMYAQIPEASVGVKGALKSYVTDVREIQLYLSNDLTPQGIEAIRPVAQRAVNDGNSLKEAIKPVLAAIDRVKAEMAQGD